MADLVIEPIATAYEIDESIEFFKTQQNLDECRLFHSFSNAAMFFDLSGQVEIVTV